MMSAPVHTGGEWSPALQPVPLSFAIGEALRRDASAFDPWVEAAIPSFQARLPIPASCEPFRSGDTFRLKRHLRSICFAPEGERGVQNVICIKGMEPFAGDFDAALDRLATYRRADSGLSMLEHFLQTEGKLPGCLLFDEAYAEASTAARVHQALFADGEPLPRLPVPVLCARLPGDVAERAGRAIAARAPRSLWSKIEALAGAGLGAYAYWYPSVPLRAVDFRPAKAAAAVASRGWIELAGRLLRAGFLPTTAASLGLGQCCNKQNAVIDGGFVDLGSIVAVAEVSGREDVFLAAQLTVWEISGSILQVIGRPLKKDASATGRLDYDAQTVMQLVRQDLARICGVQADPRLVEFFEASGSLDGVMRMLGDLPSPDTDG